MAVISVSAVLTAFVIASFIATVIRSSNISISSGSTASGLILSIMRGKLILCLLLMKKTKGMKKKGEGNKSSMVNKDTMAMIGSFTILRITSMVSMLGIDFTK